MNHAAHPLRRLTRRLGAWLTSTLPHMLIGASVLLAVPAAQAGLITFDGIGDGAVGPQTVLLNNGYQIAPIASAGSDPDSLVAVVVDGAAPFCYGFACPGSASNYLTAVNGSLVQIASENSTAVFKLNSFDAVFGSATRLRVSGTLADNTVLEQWFERSASDLSFEHLSTSGLFASSHFSALSFAGYTCDAAGCYTATQFGLDNITTAVPEASTWLMLALGLLMVSYTARRRSPAAFR